jgi:hypothetical protein
MKNTLIFLLFPLCLVSSSQAQDKVNLKLPSQETEKLNAAKGAMITGAFLLAGSALTSDQFSKGNPSLGIFIGGAAIHSAGIVLYSVGRKKR